MPRPPLLTSSHRLFYSLDFGYSRLLSAFFGRLKPISTSIYFGPVYLVHQSVSLTVTRASLCSHIKPYHHIRQYYLRSILFLRAGIRGGWASRVGSVHPSSTPHHKRWPHLPMRQLQVITHPALYEKKSWHEGTTVSGRLVSCVMPCESSTC